MIAARASSCRLKWKLMKLLCVVMNDACGMLYVCACMCVCILRQVLVSLHLEDTRARMLKSNVAAAITFSI